MSQKKNELLSALKIGAIIGISVYLVKRIIDNQLEKKSNFLGSPLGKVVSFTITNTSNSTENVTLFNSYQTAFSNPKISITPSISEFNRFIATEPKKVTSIEIRTQHNQQANAPITVMCKDASGLMNSSYLYPLISAFQSQKGITTVQPQNLVLDGTCYLVYPVGANQTVTLLLRYDEFTAKDKFSNTNKNEALNHNITTKKRKAERRRKKAKRKSFFAWF